jgi:hypothetical protein
MGKELAEEESQFKLGKKFDAAGLRPDFANRQQSTSMMQIAGHTAMYAAPMTPACAMVIGEDAAET